LLATLDFDRVFLPLLNEGYGFSIADFSINPAMVVGYQVSPFHEKKREKSLLGYTLSGILRPGLWQKRWHERKARYFTFARADSLPHRTYELYPGSAAALSYDKTTLVLRTIENHISWPIF
jgi:hypothetical protein